MGCGSSSSGIMFIGIAPGADEYRRTKRPLTGPSGQLLNALLSTCSIQRDDVFCTNLVCFWKDAPDKQEIQACSQRLWQEIDEQDPKIIVLLGKIACETMLQIPFGKARGAIIRLTGRTWLPTYHPAACLHRAASPAEKEVQIEAAYSLARDLQKLGAGLWADAEPRHIVVTELEQAQWFLDNLPDKPIALDIETNYDKDWEEAHPFDSDIVCIGIGWDAEKATVLALQPSDWSKLQWPQAQYVYHNGSFDTQEIMRHTGVWLPIGDDTMLMSYSCDERNTRGLHKLKSLAREFCGADFYEEDDHKLGGEPTQDQLARMYEYNAKDVVYTWRLHQHLTRWQEQEGPSTQAMYRDLLLPAAHMLREAQFRGIHIDRERMQAIAFQFYTEYAELKTKLNQWSRVTLGDPEFNPRSPIQVKKLLEFQGYVLPNTQKATLQQLMDDEPDIDFVPDLLRFRTLDKMCTNYLVDVSKQIKYDGRVHPHAFLTGTVTGRLTYSKPAMQTLPKPKTVRDLGVIRSIFSATTDDYVLVEADYAQIEAWLGAYFSQDPVLQADLESGDWHTAVAVGMFGKTKDDVHEWEWLHLRDAAKHINYGSMYGEEAKGLTRRPPIGIGCDLATAQAYLTKWRQHYPTFVAYQKEQQRLAQQQGYIETPFGRRRRFPFIVNDHQLRQAVNAKIQSVGGDYTLSSCLRIVSRIKHQALDCHLLFIEHDAGYWEVKKSELLDFIAILREEMERPPLPGLPSIKIEIDVGQNLAELISLNKYLTGAEIA